MNFSQLTSSLVPKLVISIFILLLISMHCKAGRWWELRNSSTGGIALMKQTILATNLKSNVWYLVRRISWLSVGLKRLAYRKMLCCVCFTLTNNLRDKFLFKAGKSCRSLVRNQEWNANQPNNAFQNKLDREKFKRWPMMGFLWSLIENNWRRSFASKTDNVTR